MAPKLSTRLGVIIDFSLIYKPDEDLVFLCIWGDRAVIGLLYFSVFIMKYSKFLLQNIMFTVICVYVHVCVDKVTYKAK